MRNVWFTYNWFIWWDSRAGLSLPVSRGDVQVRLEEAGTSGLESVLQCCLHRKLVQQFHFDNLPSLEIKCKVKEGLTLLMISLPLIHRLPREPACLLPFYHTQHTHSKFYIIIWFIMTVRESHPNQCGFLWSIVNHPLILPFLPKTPIQQSLPPVFDHEPELVKISNSRKCL